MTLKLRFQHFLTPTHYTNLQNSIISFDSSWFSAKNLSNFVSFPWKLHNRHCHDRHIADFFFSFSLYQEGLTQMTKVISIHEVWFTFGSIKSPAIHINCTTMPKRQWGAGIVYLLVLSSWKVNIAENPIAVLMGLLIRSGSTMYCF